MLNKIKYLMISAIIALSSISFNAHAQRQPSVDMICFNIVRPLVIVYEAANKGEPVSQFFQVIDSNIPPVNDTNLFFNHLNKKYVLMVYANKDQNLDTLMRFMYNSCQIELAIASDKLV
jgi:hypothetical protein